MADNLLNRVIATIKRHDLLRKGDRVLVACSGGPDSVALLRLLYTIKDNYKLDLYLAHINHKLRGKDSDLDLTFVKDLATELKLPFYLKTVNVRKLAKQKSLSIEEAARNARYGFWESLAAKHKLDKIATGHNQNDQAETVLMRLLRGTGPAGLSGIPIKRGKIIRPLLEVSRAEILDYLKRNKIKYRTDKSNLKSDFLRNRIRNQLLPQLQKEYNPNLTLVLSRTAAVSSEQNEFVQKKVFSLSKKTITKLNQNVVALNLKNLKRLNPILQKNLVRLAWDKLEGQIYPPDFKDVERVLYLANTGTSGQRVNLTKGWWAEKSRDRLFLFRQNVKRMKVRIPVDNKLTVPELGLEVNSEVLERKKLPKKILSPTENVAYLDYEKFTAPPVLRNWAKGNRFKPLGMNGTKKLSDFFVDLKVPRHQRDQIPVLSSNGKIAWVVGYRISEDFKVRPESSKVLLLEAKKLKRLLKSLGEFKSSSRQKSK